MVVDPSVVRFVRVISLKMSSWNLRDSAQPVDGTRLSAKEKFDSMDKDANGEISREEWVAKWGNDDEFDQIDTDKSGSVDPTSQKSRTNPLISAENYDRAPSSVLRLTVDKIMLRFYRRV